MREHDWTVSPAEQRESIGRVLRLMTSVPGSLQSGVQTVPGAAQTRRATR